MARGLSRDLAQAAKIKKEQSGNKGNQEGLSATQRKERDAKLMQEKQVKSHTRTKSHTQTKSH